MPSRREFLAIVTVSVGAGVAGWFFATRNGDIQPNGQNLQGMRLTDLSGKSRSLAEWKGKVLVINFWATWCPPCREEIPDLVLSRDKLQASGVEFLGIAIDQAAKVAEFVRNVPISYPVLLADPAALTVVKAIGNPSGGLPFTVVLTRNGEIAHRNLGLVTRQKIEHQVGSALAA